MSRLLFAAARKARIQAYDPRLGWISSSHAPLELSNDTRPFRIHPDDLHLQYGPVSTALREAAEDIHHPLNCARWWWGNYLPKDWAGTYSLAPWERDSPLHRSLFLLILAEALADEGL